MTDPHPILHDAPRLAGSGIGMPRTRDGVSVQALSVSDLVGNYQSVDDPWRLALVQRDLVWDELRAAELLDSLLRGYPIGSILLCRVRRPSFASEIGADVRAPRPATASDEQILDGQQRICALVSLFTAKGALGPFVLDMTADRDTQGLGRRRRKRLAAVGSIRWGSSTTPASIDASDRHRYLDLSRWQGWAASKSADEMLDLAERCEADEGLAALTLRQIDPECCLVLGDKSSRRATDRIARLLRVWSRRAIPVQSIDLDGPEDVLEVFTRANMRGVAISGDDVFFAGVKTLWYDAEERLDRLRHGRPVRETPCRGGPLLDRATALRLLARLSSFAINGSDLLPLDVERLGGERGESIVRTMRLASEESSPVVARVAALSRELEESSCLGHGLRVIDRRLLDHVFGWVAVHSRGDDRTYLRENLLGLDAYLIGTTSFGYATVFARTFLQRGFREAVAAGVAGEGFPLGRILESTRAAWPDGRSGRREIRRLTSDDDRVEFANENAELFLSVLQRIPYAAPPRFEADARGPSRAVEWDHIWPQARADFMRVNHPETGRLVHHSERRHVWSAGNLWALDQPLNLRASDELPREKFAWLESLPAASLPGVWPSERFLLDDERARLVEAEAALCADPPRVEDGMREFREFARGRTLRIIDAVTRQIPDLSSFAPSPDARAGDPVDRPIGDVGGAMGIGARAQHGVRLPPESEEAGALLGKIRVLAAKAKALGREEVVPKNFQREIARDDRLQAIVERATAVGVGAEFVALVQAARESGLDARPYAAAVMFTSPRDGRRMVFTIAPFDDRTGGAFRIERNAAQAAALLGVSEAAARDALGPDGSGVIDRLESPAFAERLRHLLAASSITPRVRLTGGL